MHYLNIWCIRSWHTHCLLCSHLTWIICMLCGYSDISVASCVTDLHGVYSAEISSYAAFMVRPLHSAYQLPSGWSAQGLLLLSGVSGEKSQRNSRCFLSFSHFLWSVSHVRLPLPPFIVFPFKNLSEEDRGKQYVTALLWNLLAKILRSFLKPRFYESFDNIKNEDLNENKLLRPSRFNVVLMKRR